MNRRQALRLVIKGGLPVGALVGAGVYGRHTFLPPRRSAHLDTVDNQARRLFDSLAPVMKAAACVEYDHPLRQYHNRGVSGGGLDIDGWRFSRRQRSVLTDLLYAGLSEQGRDRLPHQFFINWPGIHLMKLLICGDPHASTYQIVLSGPHLNLRLGGRSQEGVAFGGPMVYGDQRGNERQGLPGNVYRYQFQAAHRLFLNLEPREQQAALLPEAPIQTQVELQGQHGSFAGIEVAGLSRSSKTMVHDVIDGILSSYAPKDVAYAMRCLDENGGIDAMFLSYYEDGEVNGSGEYQIFRLEGPAAVFYFRGAPHVHAFINVAMDGESPLSVGEVLGNNPNVVEKAGVKELFENAMQDHAGSDLSYFADESIVGRLRTGTIRAGDIYNLESWQDRIFTGELQGSRIRGALLDQMRRAGSAPHGERVYKVATTGNVVRERAAREIGRVGSWQRGVMLRDATVSYLKKHGFRSGST